MRATPFYGSRQPSLCPPLPLSLRVEQVRQRCKHESMRIHVLGTSCEQPAGWNSCFLTEGNVVLCSKEGKYLLLLPWKSRDFLSRRFLLSSRIRGCLGAVSLWSFCMLSKEQMPRRLNWDTGAFVHLRERAPSGIAKVTSHSHLLPAFLYNVLKIGELSEKRGRIKERSKSRTPSGEHPPWCRLGQWCRRSLLFQVGRSLRTYKL